VIYTAPKSQKRIRAHWGWVLGGQGRLTESSGLNEESVWDCRMWGGEEFHIGPLSTVVGFTL